MRSLKSESGEEALAAIAKQRPDLILMDIQLPIMDGYTATSQIKADPALRSPLFAAPQDVRFRHKADIARLFVGL
jgi:CheY-like chemotaxis protein